MKLPSENLILFEWTLTIYVGDENPTWTANRALRFFEDGEHLSNVDLSYLKDRVTLQGGII